LYVRNQARIRAATPVPPRSSVATARAVQATTAADAGAPSAVQLTPLTELPPPSGVAPASDPLAGEWQRFFGYAREQSARLADQGRGQSAILAPGANLSDPVRRACPTPRPAVIVDLDPEEGLFVPDRLDPASPEMAAALAQLRHAGVIVLWIAQLPSARASDVATALRASGLDPDGRDQLLLIRNRDDRKQVLREQANEDVCVMAIAGDLRSDFDELFDYLRTPAGAAGLYPMMGSGWFLVPPLTADPSTAAE
jgi:hypothetical protein